MRILTATIVFAIVTCSAAVVAQKPASPIKVTEARLLRLESIDASVEQRWAPIAGLLGPGYRAFQAKGLQQSVSAIGVAKRKWQFVRVILVLTNSGSEKETVHLCGDDGTCPNVALVSAAGKSVPVWEVVTAGMFPDADGFKSTMQEHAKGVLLRHEYKGDLFVDLDPGQHTWVAVLFDASTDPGKCMLRVLDKTLPLAIAR